MTPEEMVSRLLYRDGLMLVIDKPAGMAVHRGSPNSKDRGRESLEDHFDTLRFGLPRPPALAHRLDRDTSGCLVLGRHRKALAQLGKLFRNGAIDKTYWAVVEGGPDAEEGEIDMPLGRLDANIGWWQKHDPQGQPAVTKWKVMGRSPRPDLARARTADRTHASAARALRGDGLADSGRCDLRHMRRERAARRCICMPAKSLCRFTRTARRSASSRRCRSICASGWRRAGGAGEEDWRRHFTARDEAAGG